MPTGTRLPRGPDQVVARRELGPASLSVVHAVDKALEQAKPSGSAVLVACSGGADSLALAFAAARVARTRRLGLSAVVVDHGLQQNSGAVAAQVVGQLGDLGYHDAVAVPVEVDLTAGQGVESAARAARYAVLEAEAARRDALLLLGHTLDDQAETVLLGLARGSGSRSLAGMRPQAGSRVRPLLAVTRATTEQVCAEIGVTPWRDPHNADLRYARARVRHRVLPVLDSELGPGVAAALARTADLARDDADLLEELARQAHPDEETLDCAILAELPAALRRRVIHRWLGARTGADPGYGHVLTVEALVLRWRGQQGIPVPGGVVTRSGGRLHLDPVPARKAQSSIGAGASDPPDGGVAG